MRWVIFTYRHCAGIRSCTGCTSKRISALLPVYIELFLISVHNTNTVVVTSSSTFAVNSILSFWFVCFVFKPKGILAAADILQLVQYVSLANM